MKRRNVLVLKVIYISMVQYEAYGEVGVKYRAGASGVNQSNGYYEDIRFCCC